MVFSGDDEETMAPTDETNPNSPAAEEEGPGAEVDRMALSALVREITASHFVVWTVSDSGSLQSTKIPVSDVAQQISAALLHVEQKMQRSVVKHVLLQIIERIDRATKPGFGQSVEQRQCCAIKLHHALLLQPVLVEKLPIVATATLEQHKIAK